MPLEVTPRVHVGGLYQAQLGLMPKVGRPQSHSRKGRCGNPEGFVPQAELWLIKNRALASHGAQHGLRHWGKAQRPAAEDDVATPVRSSLGLETVESKKSVSWNPPRTGGFVCRETEVATNIT